MKQEYKENITIDDVKTGEIIRTENGGCYLVVKMPRTRPRFIEIEPKNYQHVLPGKITGVFKPNGIGRIHLIKKEDEDNESK